MTIWYWYSQEHSIIFIIFQKFYTIIERLILKNSHLEKLPFGNSHFKNFQIYIDKKKVINYIYFNKKIKKWKNIEFTKIFEMEIFRSENFLKWEFSKLEFFEVGKFPNGNFLKIGIFRNGNLPIQTSTKNTTFTHINTMRIFHI